MECLKIDVPHHQDHIEGYTFFPPTLSIHPPQLPKIGPQIEGYLWVVSPKVQHKVVHYLQKQELCQLIFLELSVMIITWQFLN